MRVLYFSRDYTTHDRRFLQKLAQSRHEIFFLRLENDSIDYESRLLPDNINVVEWSGGRGQVKTQEECLRLMPDFSAVLEQIKPDLIHAGPVQSCGFMTAMSGFHPFLVMSWGSDILLDADRNEFWRWITKYTLDRSDFLFCDCTAVRNKVKEISNYSGKAILQYSWGVDIKEFSPGPDNSNFKDSLQWSENCIVLSTRNWEPIYGMDVLLRAFHKAYTKNSNLRLVLLGNGSQENAICNFVKKHELDHAVFLPGILSHAKLPDIFRASDVYLSCSFSDGSSVSLLEAMATGLPVIVTDGAGNREWVVPGQNGWLAPPGDFETFSEFLYQASIMSHEERESIRQTNRNIIERSADWNKNASKLLELYERIESQFI
ncbi:MAG: glycosyltransferase [Proteobacteria bacterium]|nr:glycosyltransferase [Pseudomonadota bacterium]MBU4258133.1 glycosyltransferase [Pseudomonadota bacterium]MBU4286787.1 glycosyltransferase [Pseudomonadota bacterium]MBU4413641.1 glycosyltransferase [Pseudomonadota bacterium]MCG2758613.1 glycosyltransferase [Desulfobacteraceae bacterium]